MTDEKTAAALAARSERAVADVIARYSRHLYTVAAAALRGVGTEQDAEEAAADAFVYLWEHPEKFDPRRGSLKTWLSVVARSRALDRSREILRCRAVSLEEIELADPLGVPEALLAGERRAALNAAVDQYLEYHEWFLAAVDKGIADADQGRMAAPQQVRATLQKWGLDLG